MQTNAEQFIQVDRQITRATHYTSLTTGEPVKFDQNAKAVYNLMYDRFQLFTSRKGDYFDTQEYIATETAISLRTVNKIISDFTKHGVFVVYSTRNKATGYKKLIYKVINTLTLVQPPTRIKPKESDNALQFVQPEAPVKAPAKAPAKPLSLVPASKPSTPTAPTVAPPVELPVDDVPPSDYDGYNICDEQEEQLPAVRRTKSSHSAPKNTEGHKVERKVVRTEDGSIF